MTLDVTTYPLKFERKKPLHGRGRLDGEPDMLIRHLPDGYFRVERRYGSYGPEHAVHVVSTLTIHGWLELIRLTRDEAQTMDAALQVWIDIQTPEDD